MTDEEALLYYDEIMKLLQGTNLEWISAQVREEVTKGNVKIKQIKDLHPLLSSKGLPTEMRRLSQEMVAVSDPYSGRDQLLILINSLEELINVNRIRKEILINIKEFQEGIQSIVMLAEDTNSVAQTLSQEVLNNDDETISRLLSTITEIKQLL